MRFAFCVLLAFVAGCGRKQIPVEGKVVAITPDALTLEIKSTPGARVTIGMYVPKGGGELVGEDGKARLTFPRKSWKGYSGDQIDVAADKSSFFTKAWGSTRVETPAPISKYLGIEKDESGLWFGPLRFGKKQSKGEIAFDFGDEKYALKLEEGAKKVVLLAAAKPGSEVKIAGKTFDAKDPGVVEAEIPMRELALGATLSSGTTKIPVEVTSDDASMRVTLALKASTTHGSAHLLKLVLAELDAVEKGTLFPSRPSITESVLVRTDDGDVRQLGKSGPVGDARFIAFEKATRRKGESCLYNTFSKTIQYDDMEVVLVEARTGKQVAKKKFIAPYATCPVIASSGESFTFWAGREKLDAWTTESAFGTKK